MCVINNFVLTEGTSYYFIAVGIVEGYGVHDVPVSLERQQLIASYCVPHLQKHKVKSCIGFR
jgi:hypothetical protein